VPTRELDSTLNARNSASGNDAVCSCLRAYTTVKSLPALSKKAETVLTHWDLGQNPDTYNWERKEAELVQPSAAELELRERTQRLLRKRKGQDVDLPGRLTFVSDEKAPMKRILGGQQSQQPQLPVLASSQVVDEPMTSTQTERGPFGGRDAFGKKAEKVRKKRKEGF